MKWFEEIFLQSLFNRVGTCKYVWLTRKQTEVCVRYMNRTTVMIHSRDGETYHHDNYCYQWEGRTVLLSYSKLNGCGSIYFELNHKECEQREREHEREREQIEMNRISRMKKHPERYLTQYKECLEMVDKIKAEMALESNTVELGELAKDLKYYQDKLEKYKLICE